MNASLSYHRSTNTTALVTHQLISILVLGASMLAMPLQAKLTTPEMVSPKAGVINAAVEIDLQWKSVKGALYYDYEIYYNGSIARNGKVYGVNNCLQTVLLHTAKTYKWRIRASNNSENSAWSDMSAFATRSPRGRSLHIGLNRVNPNRYYGWSGILTGCENDARAMEAIARSQGFTTKTLLTVEAKSATVLGAISDAATALKPGDIFMLTYSGHGGQVPDYNGDEVGGKDETWVLYDRELIDDELYALWSTFYPGVRIIVTSDSCHSGTVVRSLNQAGSSDADMPLKVYLKDESFYRNLQATLKVYVSKAVDASVILISGCKDTQYSYDGTINGVFTSALLTVWNDGRYNGNYISFHQRVLSLMPSNQTPRLLRVGKYSSSFEAQIPFTL